MPVETIKSQLAKIPQTSGIYQFFDAKDNVLYIGKAKNLRKRITSYTKENQLSARIGRMVFLAQKLEVTQTENEVEALLLEHNLIKKFAPKFNILLRDDKTFPQILITNHKFPRITKHRGERSGNGLHFGPFASGLDVNRTLDVLKKSFLLRTCTDSEFKSRQKPCLEFQIKRCSAPCTGEITQSDYESCVKNAVDFLSGKSAQVQKQLTQKMQNFSEAQNYEKAAEIRDQIKSLNSIQTKQNINVDELKDFDAITLVALEGKICAYVSFYRAGQNFGAKPYFFENNEDKNLSEFMAEFLGQFYLSQNPPSLILLNLEPSEKKLIESFLSKIAEKKVEISVPKKGAKIALIQSQEQIALQIVEQKIIEKTNNQELLLELKNIFNLPKIPQRIEVYDNSHTGTTNAVGTMIAAGVDGFIKSGYRKFNLFKNSTSQNKDDTAMLSEVLTRRFSKLEKSQWPDFIVIDGGKGQLSAAQKIFTEFEIDIAFICMSKGENRNAGEEVFHLSKNIDSSGVGSFTLPKHHRVMHYLQRLRDEAHRFAIMTHRKKRDKAMLD